MYFLIKYTNINLIHKSLIKALKVSYRTLSLIPKGISLRVFRV